MAHILPYIQVALALLLIGCVLLQRSEASLGSAFGGDGMTSQHNTRRGFEKTLFTATIVIAILFAVATFSSLLLGR